MALDSKKGVVVNSCYAGRLALKVNCGCRIIPRFMVVGTAIFTMALGNWIFMLSYGIQNVASLV